MNLVANGINYTPEGGQVKIQLSSDEKQVKIVISDTGIGIAKRIFRGCSSAFTAWIKGAAAPPAAPGWLAIVKHVVMSMKGGYSGKSEVGKGSSFIVTLPKADKTESIKYRRRRQSAAVVFWRKGSETLPDTACDDLALKRLSGLGRISPKARAIRLLGVLRISTG